MLGAYYGTRPLQRIAGLGAVAEQSMNDVALSTIQALLQRVTPLGTFVPWAGQVGEIDWKVVAPDTRYALYPVTSDLLTAVETAAFGQPVGFVVALSAQQLSLASATSLFNGTPFEYFSTDAVYNVADTKPAPTIQFVYWGRLRADAQTVGSYNNLEKQAQNLGVQLAFPVYVNVPAGATQPPIDFSLALRSQQIQPTPTPPPLSPANVVPVPGTPAAILLPGAAPAASTPGTGVGAFLLVLAVGGVAAYAGYRVVKGRRKAAA